MSNDLRSLYDLTGDIKDINTMLVPRSIIAQQQATSENFPGDLCRRCYGSGKDPCVAGQRAPSDHHQESSNHAGYSAVGSDSTTRTPAATELTKAYRKGWERAAEWANRQDLFADVGSPSYLKDMAEDLSPIIPETAAGPLNFEVHMCREAMGLVFGSRAQCVYCSNPT